MEVYIVLGSIDYFAPEGALDLGVFEAFVEDVSRDLAEAFSIACHGLEERGTSRARSTEDE